MTTRIPSPLPPQERDQTAPRRTAEGGIDVDFYARRARDLRAAAFARLFARVLRAATARRARPVSAAAAR